MNIEFTRSDPVTMTPAAVASQSMIAAAQSSHSPVGMAETVEMEDTYTKRDGQGQSSDAKNPMTPHDRSLQISVSEETGMQIKIVDSTTKEVVREIPPEQLQRTLAEIRRISGLLFNKRI
jgi:flagellar protein FlaG